MLKHTQKSNKKHTFFSAFSIFFGFLENGLILINSFFRCAILFYEVAKGLRFHDRSSANLQKKQQVGSPPEKQYKEKTIDSILIAKSLTFGYELKINGVKMQPARVDSTSKKELSCFSGFFVSHSFFISDYWVLHCIFCIPLHP
jgi:hypothetical protein